MSKKITQEQRLDYLVEEFKADSGEYKDLQTPADAEGKRRKDIWEWSEKVYEYVKKNDMKQ